MFEVGDIVKIRREWLNPGENAHDRYIVADVNEVTQRCGIRSLNSKLALPCVETVGFEMIEMIASHRIVYTVCFHRRDEKPAEEYEYHNKDDAERHFELFRDDDSGLYSHIDLTETRIGLPEVILQTINFQPPQINQEKLAAYLRDEMILEFDSPEECLSYFNTYDGQSLHSVGELREFQGQYGFGFEGKWYHICFEEALDVLGKPPLASVIEASHQKADGKNTQSRAKDLEPDI